MITDVQSLPEQPDSAPSPRLLDRQGWSTLAAGTLLLLISFTTTYGDDNLSRFRRLPAHDKVGMGLHLAALAALAGDVQLASRLRIEQRTRQHELNALASEKRMQESEKRLLESEKRLKLLQESNARIARFEQELFSSSNQAPSTGDSSPT